MKNRLLSLLFLIASGILVGVAILYNYADIPGTDKVCPVLCYAIFGILALAVAIKLSPRKARS